MSVAGGAAHVGRLGVEASAMRRLHRIEGQVRRISRVVEDDRSVEILTRVPTTFTRTSLGRGMVASAPRTGLPVP